jgi:hypothetical protein
VSAEQGGTVAFVGFGMGRKGSFWVAQRTTGTQALAPSTTLPTMPRSCSVQKGTTSRRCASRTSSEGRIRLPMTFDRT